MTIFLMVVAGVLLLYIAVAATKGGNLPESYPGKKGVAVVVTILLVAILMLNIGWWTASAPPEPEVIVLEPYLQKLAVRTDRFSCIPIPRNGPKMAFRIETDAEELTLVEWHYQDGRVGIGLDHPGGREQDQNLYPLDGLLDRACLRSIDPEGEGYIVSRIEWFECGEEGMPPCFIEGS